MPTPGLSWIDSSGRLSLVAMVHVGALPGTPHHTSDVASLARMASQEAQLLADGGVDSILIENMHDRPYLNRRVGPEIVAAMTKVCSAIRSVVSLPLGVQILAGANREAVAVAQSASLQYVRCEGFVFAQVADEGLMAEADAGGLLRYRRSIGADDIALLVDIKKKHASHALTADAGLVETAEAAAFFGADAIVVTGRATGEPTDPSEVRAVRKCVSLPVCVGSGVTTANVDSMASAAHVLIVGSALKQDGQWFNPPDRQRVRDMVDAVRRVNQRA